MNGIDESLEFLQTLRYGILSKNLFLELRGIKEFEDQLGKRRGQVGVWIEYVSKIRRDIEVTRDGLHHEVAYMIDRTELNQELDDWKNTEMQKKQGIDDSNLELMYKQDYCLLILRRALSSTNRRVLSIWLEYLSFIEEYENFMETKLGKELIGLDLSNEYENSLKSCNDLDLWLRYNAYLCKSRLELTNSRLVLDRSLKSLPIEQHHKIWERYLEYIMEVQIPELSISVLRRFLIFSYVEGIRMYIQALIDGGRYEECLDRLVDVVLEKEGNLRVQETFEGLKKGLLVGGINYKVSEMDSLIVLVLAIISEYVLKINPKKIIEYTMNLMLRKLKTCDGRVYQEIIDEEVTQEDRNTHKGGAIFRLTFGEVVCKVAQIFMRLADWEQVKSTFNFGVENCHFVYDFITIYDSLMMFSTIHLSRVLKSSQNLDSSSSPMDEDPQEIIKKSISDLERVIEEHKRLLFRTLVKSDTNNVSRWIEYINVLIQEETKEKKSHPSLKVVKIFEEAIDTIDFSKVKDKSKNILWVFYASYMTSAIDNGHDRLDLDKNRSGKSDQLIDLARDIFERGLSEDYIEDYSLIWTEWIEMELRFGNFEEALNLSRRSICMAKEQKSRITLRSSRIWHLAADLEMSFGTLESTRVLIEDLFESGMVTASLSVTFGAYLRSKECYEESFSLYERSMNCLTIQYSFGLWLDYIDSFIFHHNNGLSIYKLFDEADTDSIEYGNSKIDRLRDVFDQCLESLLNWKKANINEKDRKYYLNCVFIAYSVYSAYEAKIGRVSRAFDIFNKAMDELEDHDQHKLNLYSRWIKLTLKCRDISYTREIFDKAIDDIKASDLIIRLALRYVNFELNMGEVNRVRSIFIFAGDLIPNIYLVNEHIEIFNRFWNTWNQFEVEYGNEDTIKDMLRAKKNVALVSGHSSIHSTQLMQQEKQKEYHQSDPVEVSDQNLEDRNISPNSDSDDEILLSTSSDEQSSINQESDEDMVDSESDSQIKQGDSYSDNNEEI
ncbi:HAT domain-containing protein [Cryptosporidium ubiquitum]|uniref:HAT domain-containing protein n=1 Tax=Cryptosporidium ubiquitum TaxID=857276 RepID=A0A1J4MIB9_9CRYT|nr:HAT domain-containing protein [Cryptosporidium ubiquitum]OII73969.1 HAT domain-containing protein [Cryptosporidium ubiquitum]